MKWPSRTDIVTIFLPIGPLGRGSFAITDLGAMTQRVTPVHISAKLLTIVVGGICISRECVGMAIGDPPCGIATLVLRLIVDLVCICSALSYLA
jgi:hypothetical protein